MSVVKIFADAAERKRRLLEEKAKLISSMKETYTRSQREHCERVEKYKAEIEARKRAAETFSQSSTKIAGEIDSLKKQRVALKDELSESAALLAALRENEGALKRAAELSRLEVQAATNACSELGAENKRLAETLLRAQNREKSKYDLRKDRHNYMQELKGNIRVYCRIRPRLASEPPGKEVITLLNEQTLEVVSQSGVPGAGVSSNKGLRTERFALDKVFGPEATQDDVFAEVSSFVKSVLDGYNVCIFAYGQTGTGKTFTMEGELEDPHRHGIIPRSIGQVFSTIRELEKWGWKYHLSTSIQEIYNEKLIDLLRPENNILQNANMHSYQPTQAAVSTPDELFSYVKLASLNRTTAETKFNASSSRSHSICQIWIHGENAAAAQHVESVLNLIDLAGSESLSSALMQKDREQETKSINKSLSALKDVITALAERKEHVPTRNSKLTYLLKDFLGGNCKTLMFVNISALATHTLQTIQSLRFACKVNNCFVNMPKKTPAV